MPEIAVSSLIIMMKRGRMAETLSSHVTGHAHRSRRRLSTSDMDKKELSRTIDRRDAYGEHYRRRPAGSLHVGVPYGAGEKSTIVMVFRIRQ